MCRAAAAAFGLGLVGLSGCAGAASVGCRAPDERPAGPAVPVAQARERDGEFLLVRGSLIARDGRPYKLCAVAVATDPPNCKEPSLRVEGYRDNSAFDLAVEDGVVGPVDVIGRVAGDTLRYELSCRAQQVQRHVGEATGEEPTYNPFASNVGTETLDWYAPGGVPREVSERYGTFSLVVELDEDDEPVFRDVLEGVRSAGGVYWLSDEGDWSAVKRYGDDVAVVWRAGARRRLDERWQRLDRVLGELPPRSG